MATQIEPRELDLQEQIARIRRAQIESDKFVADTHKAIEERLKIERESIKLERETKFMPASLIFQAMLAAAALIGAGATITKLFFSH